MYRAQRRGTLVSGTRASWVATWPGRWTLGAGGSVELGESPIDSMARELEEEWSVPAEGLQVEALLGLPRGVAMLVGQVRLPPSTPITRDDEHDEHAWWPADIDRWPPEADPSLHQLAKLLIK